MGGWVWRSEGLFRIGFCLGGWYGNRVNVQRKTVGLLAGALLCGGGLNVAVPPAAMAQRVPCTDVLKEFSRVISRSGTTSPDPIRIGRTLGVDPQWVERCALMFGRRLSRKAPGSKATKDVQIERWEAEEYEKISREELEAAGDVDLDVEELETSAERRGRDRRRQGAEWRPYESRPWRPDTGEEWSPTLLDE